MQFGEARLACVWLPALAWLAARVSALAAATDVPPAIAGLGTALAPVDAATGRTLTPLAGSAPLHTGSVRQPLSLRLVPVDAATGRTLTPLAGSAPLHSRLSATAPGRRGW